MYSKLCTCHCTAFREAAWTESLKALPLRIWIDRWMEGQWGRWKWDKDEQTGGQKYHTLAAGDVRCIGMWVLKASKKEKMERNEHWERHAAPSSYFVSIWLILIMLLIILCLKNRKPSNFKGLLKYNNLGKQQCTEKQWISKQYVKYLWGDGMETFQSHLKDI